MRPDTPSPSGPPTAPDHLLPSGVVTFVFTDIEGSTTLFDRLGDAYVPLHEQHNAILRDVFSRHGGVEVKNSGDGFLLAFTQALPALEACTAMQLALAQARWPDGLRLHVRMGVHVGTADARDGDYVALAVNQAARICAAAHGGQIIASAAALEAAGPTVASRDLGRFVLRGFATPVALAQILADGLEDEFAVPQARSFAQHNLPASRTAFIGRTDERDRVVRALGSARLVTVCGPGGSGKTRLAYETASAMVELLEDGVWAVPLATVATPDHMLAAIVSSLELQTNDLTPEGVARELRDFELLLVLDNCEHVIDAAAEVTDAILAVAPGVRILATSREQLGIDGETTLRLGALTPNDALLLVYDRIGAVRPGFVPSAEDERAAIELLDRLDGMPLALELAAARTATMTLTEVLDGLRDPLRLLAVVRRGQSERHGSLRAVLDWSHALLDEDEQVLLRQLAVFAGGVSRATVTRVCATTDADAVLTRLADKNLVVVQHDRAPTSYRLLEPVRAYAGERLLAAGERAGTRARLLAWAVELAEAYHAGGPDDGPLRTVVAEHTALLGALGDEDQDGADDRLRVAGALARRWAVDRPGEAAPLLEHALAAAPNAAPAVRLRALSGLARVLDMRGISEPAFQAEEAALALGSQVGPSPDLVWCVATFATHLAFAGRFDDALQHLDEAWALAGRLDDDRARAVVLRRRAYVLRELGDPGGARAAAEADLELSERGQDGEAILAALIEVGIAANYDGDGRAAAACGERAILLARQYGLIRSECLALTIVQLAAVLTGDRGRATEATAEALTLARGHRLGTLVRDALDFAVIALHDVGRSEDAAVVSGGAELLKRDAGNPRADAAIVAVRERLGAAAFDKAHAHGAALAPADLDRRVLAALAAADDRLVGPALRQFATSA